MKTVLLVDDEPSMLEAISNMFTSNGWNVVTSRNGTDAAALVGERCFDLVVTDVVMEGLVGTALLYQIRASPAGADTPTVFMSNMPEARVRSISRCRATHSSILPAASNPGMVWFEPGRDTARARCHARRQVPQPRWLPVTMR